MRNASGGRIAAELGLVLLVVGCLLATYGLVKQAYESARGPSSQREEVAAEPALRPAEPTGPTVPAPIAMAQAPPAEPEPAVATEPAPPGPDPTQVELDRLAELTEKERLAAQAADAQIGRQLESAEHLETERKRWHQRAALVKDRAKQLEKMIRNLEQSLQTAEQQRASLTQVRAEQDSALKAALARGEDTYSVTPYKGPSGTWRQPIVVDCGGDSVQVLPDGKIHGSSELGPIPNARAVALVYEVRKKAREIQQQISSDGAATVPYILFLVRPSGVRHYYDARSLLESSGIAFGYELIGQDWQIEVPGSSSTAASSSPLPRNKPLAQASVGAASGRGSAVRAPGNGETDDLYVWPTDSVQATGTGTRNTVGMLQPSRELGVAATADGTSSGSGGLSDFGPADLLEPPGRRVPDPRRHQTADSAGLTGPGDGYQEILPRHGGREGIGTRPGTGRTATSNENSRPAPGAAVAGMRSGGRPSQTGLHGGVVPAPATNERTGLAGTRSGNRAAPGGGLAAPNAPFPAGNNRTNGHEASNEPTQLALNAPASDPSDAGSQSHGTTRGATSTRGFGTAESFAHPEQGDALVSGDSQAGSNVGRTGAGTGSSSEASGRSGQGSDPSQQQGQEPGQGAREGASASPAAGMSGGSGSSAAGDASAAPGSQWLSTPGNAQPGSAGPAGANEAADGLPPRMSEEWFDLVVACQPHGVTIQPGGYRLSQATLKNGTLLVDRVRQIYDRSCRDEHGRVRRPRLHFVVESGGQQSFWLAREQTSFVGLDWPATLSLAESIRWDRWTDEEVRK